MRDKDIKIAKAIGWKDIERHDSGYVTGTRPQREMEDAPQFRMVLPHYTLSRDACAEFEEWMDEDQKQDYLESLDAACTLDWLNGKTKSTCSVFANADQRSRTFLALLDIWFPV